MLLRVLAFTRIHSLSTNILNNNNNNNKSGFKEPSSIQTPLKTVRRKEKGKEIRRKK